jgi:hypothetical protein
MEYIIQIHQALYCFCINNYNNNSFYNIESSTNKTLQIHLQLYNKTQRNN